MQPWSFFAASLFWFLNPSGEIPGGGVLLARRLGQGRDPLEHRFPKSKLTIDNK